MSIWWLVWMGCMLLFLVSSVRNGSRYARRRRMLLATVGGGPSTIDHHAGGFGRYLLWAALLLGLFWAASVFWWR